MKLPFTFGTRLIFRIVLPGMVLAAFFYPAVNKALLWAGLTASAQVMFPLLAVLLGWVVSLLDIPIYMLLEGRRFWPRGLAYVGLRQQASRLARWQKRATFHRAELQAYRKKAEAAVMEERPELFVATRHHDRQLVEAELEVASYPLSPDRRREALYPTRLGNILAEHETYPTRKYGLDGVFYWYRIWIGLPKDLRDEIDELQALVDGTLYISFCFIAGAVLLTTYTLADLILGVAIIPPQIVEYWWLCNSFAVLLSVLFYRMSLPSQRRYGEFFKALFDRFHDDAKLQPALDMLSEILCDPRVKRLKGREAHVAAWRYLKWDRVRLPGSNENQDIADLRDNPSSRS